MAQDPGNPFAGSIFSGILENTVRSLGPELAAQEAARRSNMASSQYLLPQSADLSNSQLSQSLEAQRAQSQNVNPALAGGSNTFSDIDALIQARTPQALNILNQGSAEQQRLQQLGTDASLMPLQQVDDMRAFNEQQAILGQSGLEAQEQAIGNIPVSQFDLELQRRQQQRLMRGASARGEAGGGSTLMQGQQLAGAQQANMIQQRLEQLSPLVSASRGVRSSMSGIIEQGGVGQANLQSGLGTQLGNVRLGAAAPQMQSIQRGAEISGLQGIASANATASRNNQLAGLAGTLAGSFSG